MLALEISLSRLACALLVIALAACNSAQFAAADEHNANNNNYKTAAVGAVSTAAPVLAAVANHLTTNLPLKATHAPTASAAPVVHHDKLKVAGVATSVVTTFAPIIAHPAASAAAAHPPAHAVAPTIAITKAPATNLNAIQAATSAVKAAATVAPATTGAVLLVSVPQRLAAYFEPICHQVDKLEPKQMFKIQAQMKQFIEKTAGKMSLCFMQHYSIDPNMTPVNKLQLTTICSSRPLGIGVKGSFKNFQACAEQNWDKNLDAELERITRLCENCAPSLGSTAATVKTGHSTAKPAVSAHDQQNVKEATVISDVVSKVFDNNQGALNKTDIKMIDVGPKAGAAAGATVSNQLPSKEVLNDPNTMVVFVDEPTKTTLKPSGAAKPAAAVAHHAAAVPASAAPPAKAAAAAALAPAAPATPASRPALVGLLTTFAPKPLANVSPNVATIATAKPSLAGVVAGKVVAKSTVTPAPGIIKPTSISVASGARSGLGDKILSAVSTIEKLGKGSTTTKPAGSKSATAKPGSSKSTTTGAPKKGSSSKKPSGAPKGGSSTGKPETTAKAKAASTSAAPSKSSASKSSSAASTKKPAAGNSTAPPTGKSKGGQIPPATAKVATDAKNAIKALQLQRAQQTHGASDAHLHQFEHQRQMAIDPIGHTIKHQQYEQRKAAAAASAALAGAPASRKL